MSWRGQHRIAVLGIACASLVAALFHKDVQDWIAPKATRVAAPELQPNSADASHSVRKQESAGEMLADAENAPQTDEAPRAPSVRTRRALDQGIEQFVLEIDLIRKRARGGDVDAMKALYRGLHHCIGIPKNQQELEQNMRAIAADADDENRANSVASARRFQSRLQSLCSRTGPHPENEHYQWLLAAAETGDSQAKLDFIVYGAPDPQQKLNAAEQRAAHRRLGKEYLEEEIAARNPQALWAASMSFDQNGIFPPDPQSEYMYLYAYSLSTAGGGDAVFARLQSLRNRMSDAMLASATQRGEELYRGCCLN
jgi:hypothetical protein